jgi:hypothetical protein
MSHFAVFDVAARLQHLEAADLPEADRSLPLARRSVLLSRRGGHPDRGIWFAQLHESAPRISRAGLYVTTD